MHYLIRKKVDCLSYLTRNPTYLIVGRWAGVEIKRILLKDLVLKKPNMKESEVSVCVPEHVMDPTFNARWGNPGTQGK